MSVRTAVPLFRLRKCKTKILVLGKGGKIQTACTTMYEVGLKNKTTKKKQFATCKYHVHSSVASVAIYLKD